MGYVHKFKSFVSNRENFDIEEDFVYNMSPKDKRQIRKIIYDHFEYIEEQWDEFQRRLRGRKGTMMLKM